MTNEEKAKEILEEHNKLNVFRVGTIGYNTTFDCIKNALDYKEQQFKEYKNELFERVWDVFQKYATYTHPRKGTQECVMTKSQLRGAIEL